MLTQFIDISIVRRVYGFCGNATMRFPARDGFASTGDFTGNALGKIGFHWQEV